MSGKVFIIAEAGVNHNGDLNMVHRLIDAAATAGADAVKFQSFESEKLASAFVPRAAYQERSLGDGDQLTMLRSLEIRGEWYEEVAAHCRRASVEFMSTPFHKEAADALQPLVRRFKIGSGDLTDFPLIEHVARLGKPMILSTGMSNYGEIESAVEIVRRYGVPLTLLQCTSLYPTPYDLVNLNTMSVLEQKFELPVGFSDHTEGIAVAIAAAAKGAAVIEKHVTLDRKLPGPDHQVSLEPDELKMMVQSIRQVERALGDGIKKVVPGEEEIRKVARKSIVAAQAIDAGAALKPEMLAIKRPGTGISPSDLQKVLGRRIQRRVRLDEPLTWEMFE